MSSASNQGHSLDTVPEDVHRLILSELEETSPSAVRNFAGSSKALQDVAQPFVYRTLVLSPRSEGSKKSTAYRALMAKFSDTSCDVARHVRSIMVQDEVPEEDLILVLNKIAESGNLRKLNWNTSEHMPPAVLSKLHSTWPDLELSVTVVDRHDAKLSAHPRQWRMDIPLLSSPLLTQLTYVVYTKGYESQQPTRSEWPELTAALLSGGNIRSLRIQSQQDGSAHYGAQILATTGPVRLPRLNLRPGARLEKLEELNIRALDDWGDRSYFWDDEHCRALHGAVDPSRLRKLDFGSDNPVPFFNAFAGVLSNVQSLRFGVRRGSDVEPAKRFIESLTGLESVYVSSPMTGLDELWPAIEGHKDTLKSLVLGPTWGEYCRPTYIDRSVLETVAKTFSKLKHLGWDVPFGTTIDPDYLAIISSMNLKKLDMFLHIGDAACDYSSTLQQNPMGTIPAPPLDKEGSVAAAMKIAEAVSGKKERLEWLTMHITRTGYSDRYQPYMMDTAFQLRRNECATAAGGEKYNVRGKMAWYSTHDLSEELLFEEK
ncbi:hypothetical protein BU23DRAFT_550929 [Bimuria novae-zelandiae CBS 107.79]|uniref:Uncharacterized protein n=1 Tax=Bimuria novae-zelandiae CBS 107.79 TaxID=1447943 RepID=A0A6A5VID6_9PLEO|nr:hypothetical protein BU23DRAFT_550929 [Bimuria novae-zelandiae CBS 107.79]